MSLKHDPQEDAPALRALIDAADHEADDELADNPHRGHMGFCHIFWETKKRILLEKHGIRWKSPAEMNPGVIFD